MSPDVYSAEEIARAAGVPARQVVAALRGATGLVSFDEAVCLGRLLAYRAHRARGAAADRPLFSSVSPVARQSRSRGVPLVVSSTLHLTMLAVAVFVTTLGLAPTSATLRQSDRLEPTRLVFIATPGPGGGGGGGGLAQPAPPPTAMRAGHEKMSSPIPVRRPPARIVRVVSRPEPRPTPAPVRADRVEPLPAVLAPIVAAPADPRTRVGVLAQAATQAESHGPGRGGGAGTGTGTGIGEGEGAGIGPGSGGGIGGGPYRPGSGIDAPQLTHEVRADYTEDARQRGIEGDVVLEIVVRRDGSVGNVRVLQGLGSGLSDRAVQAVRQWRFAPARHLGAPVDVIVEVAVEFKLR